MEKSASDGEATAVPLPDSWNFKAEMVAAGGGGGGGRPVIPMGHGDPSAFPCFRTAPEAVDAVAGALQSGEYNSYSTCVGLEPARR
jgi:tyrosine aminotransferase